MYTDHHHGRANVHEMRSTSPARQPLRSPGGARTGPFRNEALYIKRRHLGGRRETNSSAPSPARPEPKERGEKKLPQSQDAQEGSTKTLSVSPSPHLLESPPHKSSGIPSGDFDLGRDLLCSGRRSSRVLPRGSWSINPTGSPEAFHGCLGAAGVRSRSETANSYEGCRSAARLHELFRESGTELQLQPLRRLPPHLPPAFLPAAPVKSPVQFQFQFK